MNSATEQPPPPPLPLHQPLQPHRSSFSCDRHPTEQFTGFCPSCLCERLSTLDQSSAAAASSSRRPSNASASTTAAAAIRAIFRVPISIAATNENWNSNTSNKSKNKQPSTSSSFFPELRRTKSFSASKNEGFSGVFEPQRKSCDVRVRNTLWSLFNLDDERKFSSKRDHHPIEVETGILGSVSSCVTGPVFESKEEDDEHDDHEYDDNDDNGDGEIRVCEEPNVANIVEETVGESAEEEREEVKMKDHMGLDSQSKKSSGMDLKEIAGSFWSAASVFSKKWHNWRSKPKLKKRNTGGESAALPVEKPISQQYRETQSEIADYGFGRRSCDTDPRFSLDTGRISFDDSRYSFDEPRASWDGYLIGKTFPRLPPMLSVVEDAPVAHISRSDTQIPVEHPVNKINGEEKIPGGSTQTREYYSDSSRRRKSLDRSNSIKKAAAAAVMAESDEMKAVSNAKVSPATIDYLQGAKLLVGDRDLKDSNSNSLRDDCSETFELGFGENPSLVIGNGEQKCAKKSRRWSQAWNILGFIHRRRRGNKDEDEDRYSRRNGIERSLSESWQELRRDVNGGNGETREGCNRKMLRSNSSVSWRNSYNNSGSFGSEKKPSLETNGNGKKKREEFGLDRNHIDNGLLRFYLTPMRSSGRRGGLGKSTVLGESSHEMSSLLTCSAKANVVVNLPMFGFLPKLFLEPQVSWVCCSGKIWYSVLSASTLLYPTLLVSDIRVERGSWVPRSAVYLCPSPYSAAPVARSLPPKVEKRMVALGPRLWRLIDGLEGRGSVDVPLTRPVSGLGCYRSRLGVCVRAPRPAFDLIAELGVGSYVDPQSGREGWVEVCVRLGFIDRPGSSGFLVSRRPEHPKPLLARGYCICLSLLHSIWFWWSPPFLAFEIGPSWDASEDLTLIFVSSSSLLWLATIVGLGVCWVGEDFRRAGGEC
ncbi:hypothetical protein U1Q18_008522 [Sarracenia purpurea var. burkii]